MLPPHAGAMYEGVAQSTITPSPLSAFEAATTSMPASKIAKRSTGPVASPGKDATDYSSDGFFIGYDEILE